MKANKKTLLAVKSYLQNHEGYDFKEVVSDMISELEILKTDSMGDTLLSMDDCTVTFDGDYVCDLEEFVDDFSNKFIEQICNVLDSFIGEEDIECYLEGCE